MSNVALLAISVLGLAGLLVIATDVLVSERRRRRALRDYFSTVISVEPTTSSTAQGRQAAV